MAKVFVNQIKLGTITIDTVPGRWREQVEELLAEQTGSNETAAE